MYKINGSDPAFPFVETNEPSNVAVGMTIRTQLAAMAMQGLVMRSPAWENVTDVASKSVQLADALIDELNKE